MAITQASMAEEILTRQERAVVRGIYRASQLAETLTALQKVTDTLRSYKPADEAGKLTLSQVESTPLHDYLLSAIAVALISIKAPTINRTKKEVPLPSKT